MRRIHNKIVALGNGKLVAYPTESFYALGAGLDEKHAG